MNCDRTVGKVLRKITALLLAVTLVSGLYAGIPVTAKAASTVTVTFIKPDEKCGTAVWNQNASRKWLEAGSYVYLDAAAAQGYSFDGFIFYTTYNSENKTFEGPVIPEYGLLADLPDEERENHPISPYSEFRYYCQIPEDLSESAYLVTSFTEEGADTEYEVTVGISAPYRPWSEEPVYAMKDTYKAGETVTIVLDMPENFTFSTEDPLESIHFSNWSHQDFPGVEVEGLTRTDEDPDDSVYVFTFVMPNCKLGVQVSLHYFGTYKINYDYSAIGIMPTTTVYINGFKDISLFWDSSDQRVHNALNYPNIEISPARNGSTVKMVFTIWQYYTTGRGLTGAVLDYTLNGEAHSDPLTIECELNQSGEDIRTIEFAMPAADATVRFTETEELYRMEYLQSLIDKAKDGETLKLSKMYAYPLLTEGGLTIKQDREITLDLNGNTLQTYGKAPVITVESGAVLTITDSSAEKTGKITGGSGTNGGGICNYGTIYLEGGTITGSTAENGAGIYNEGALYLKGGAITGNTAEKCGGAVYNAGKLYAEGAPTTIGNDASFGKNIFLSSGTVLRLNGEFTEGVNLGIWSEDAPGIITYRYDKYHGDADPAQFFTFDEEAAAARITDGEVEIVSYWAELQAMIRDEKNENKTISMTQNVRAFSHGDSELVIPYGRTIIIDLNGFTLDRNLSGVSEGGSVFHVISGGDLTIMDSSDGKTGRITGGFAEYGGGIFNEGGLNLKNVTITGNTAAACGGGIYSTAALSAEGSAVVLGNSAATGSDIYLAAGKVIEIAGKLADDAKMGVAVENMVGTFTKNYGKYHGSDDPAAWFVPVTGLHLAVRNQEAVIESVWAELQSRIDNAENGSTVTLDRNYIAIPGDKRLTIAVGKEITVDLNGYTIDRNLSSAEFDGQVFRVEGSLTIEDSAGGGCIKGGSNDGKGGGIFVSGSQASVTLKGGIITGNKAVYGAGISADNSAQIIVEGGEISKNIASSNGGGIFSMGGPLTMSGGRISGNEAGGNGGGIYLQNQKLTFNGGTVWSNKAGEKGGGIWLVKTNDDSGTAGISMQGAPVVMNNIAKTGGDLCLPAGMKLDITGTMSFDAHVRVYLASGTGVFTSGYAKSNTAGPECFFRSCDRYQVDWYREDYSAVEAQMVYGSSAREEEEFIKYTDRIEDPDTLDGSNWMAGVSGERYLNEINIPCTHDSGCNWWQEQGVLSVGAFFTKTQWRYIDEQLDEGIRKLDIRLNNYSERILSTALCAFYYIDNGRDLYVTHGKTSMGTYWQLDKDGDLLSFSKILGHIEDFLTRNPTETVIVSFEAETQDNEKWYPVIFDRAGRMLYKFSEKINPSTGKSFLYKPEGQDYMQAYYMPQLKDCRGQLVIMANSPEDQKYLGGFTLDNNGRLNTAIENNYSSSVSEKISLVYDFYKQHETTPLPVNAAAIRHYNYIYSMGTYTSGPNKGIDAVDTYGNLKWPVYFAKYVQMELFKPGGLFDKKGVYFGWVRLDGALPDVNRYVWSSNYGDNLDYCTVTVKAGTESDVFPDKTYKLLRHTKITIPGCIYDYDPAQTGGYFGGWTAESPHKEYDIGDECLIENDITFTAKWVESTEYPVEIAWDDSGNRDGLRPDKLKVVFTGDLDNDGKNEIRFEKTFTAAEDWKGSLDVPVTDVSIAECSVVQQTQYRPHGSDYEGQYRYELLGNWRNGIKVRLVHTPNVLRDFSGTVTWVDNDNENGVRPKNVKVSLLADGEKVSTKTVSSDTGWMYRFMGWPLHVDGNEVEYTIVQDEIDQYNTIVDGTNISNVGYGQCGDIPFIVTWEDDDNKDSLRPGSVTVRLMNGEKETSSREVRMNEETGYWGGYFTDIPLYNAANEEIDYIVVEDEIDGYISSVVNEGGFHITNTREAEAPEKYNIFIGGKQITSANKDDVFEDGTVSYDPENKVLTMNNAVIETNLREDGSETTAEYGLRFNEPADQRNDLTVNLIGNNRIVNEETAEGVLAVYGMRIYQASTLTLTGSGTLEVSMKAEDENISYVGINSRQKTDIDGTAVVIDIPGTAKTTGYELTYSNMLTLKNSASLTVTTGSHELTYAMTNNRDSANLTVEEGSTLEVSSENSAFNSQNKITDETAALGASVGKKYGKIIWDGETELSSYRYVRIPCDVPRKPAFQTQALLLTGNIGLVFYMYLPEIEGVDYSESYMEFNVSGKNDGPTRAYYDADFLNADGLYYGFTCYLNSIQMADTVTAVFHYGDGRTVERDYSIAAYLDTIQKGDYGQALTELCTAINDYGYYAQQYLSALRGWKLGTDHKALAFGGEITETDREAALSESGNYRLWYDPGDAAVLKLTYSLILDCDTGIRIYLTSKAGYEGDVTAYIGDSTENAAVKQKNGKYIINITDIDADKINEMHTVKVTAGGTAELRVSALSYVNTVLKNAGQSEDYVNTVTALYKYYAKTIGYIEAMSS